MNSPVYKAFTKEKEEKRRKKGKREEYNVYTMCECSLRVHSVYNELQYY